MISIKYTYLMYDRIEGMQRISEAVFVVMFHKVGSSEQIVIKREAMNIGEVLDIRIISKDRVIRMLNGSRREGFRLKGSIKHPFSLIL